MGIQHILESESIDILREAVATARKPVMMYSIGKDSSVMLHLARKAFYRAPPPFPLLHVNTGWEQYAGYGFKLHTPIDTEKNPPPSGRGSQGTSTQPGRTHAHTAHVQ